MSSSTALILASAGPIVSVKDGRAFANSRDVAEFFGKQHADVLRDIETIICVSDPEEGSSPNFGETSYAHPQNGQTYRSFAMDQEGFTLLAMGFTGPRP